MNNREKIRIDLMSIFQVIKAKHGLYKEGKVKIFEIPFLARKIGR